MASSSSYSAPVLEPAGIVEAMYRYEIAPSIGLRAEDIINPQPGFVAEVLQCFLASYLGDAQLQLQSLDNAALVSEVVRVYERANAFLQSIQFRDLTFRDLLNADGTRVVHILSALINFLHFREHAFPRRNTQQRTPEEMAKHKVQEKTNTTQEMYAEVSEKRTKRLSKITAALEISAAVKAAEKDVQAHKEKISDQDFEIQALRNKAAEWQIKVLENEAKLKAKEKERDQTVGENKRKMAALKSEVESEHKCLEEKQREIQKKIDKSAYQGSELCSQADLVAEAAKKKIENIRVMYNQFCEAAVTYEDGVVRRLMKLLIRPGADQAQYAYPAKNVDAGLRGLKYNQVFEAATMYEDGVDRSFKVIDEAEVKLNNICQSVALDVLEVTLGQWIMDK